MSLSASTVQTSLASAPDQFFTSGDARIRYREIGRGEPVVLLHGLAGSLEEWLGVADSLARDHRVIALDLRGSGQSTRFAERSHYGAPMADDVVRLLDHRHLQRAHLVGHSMGAMVAANVAARYPARVASVASLSATPPDVFAALLASVSSLMVPSAQMQQLHVPVLVTAGSGDPLLLRARWLGAVWPGARLLEIDGANHGDIIGRPEVWTAVRTLMRTHPLTSARLSRGERSAASGQPTATLRRGIERRGAISLRRSTAPI